MNLYYFIFGYVVYLLLVALHELGHLLAFLWLGIGWSEFQVGPLAFQRQGKETHLVYSSQWFGGRVRTILRDGKILTAKQNFIHLAAGGVVNLAVGLALILIFLRMSPQNKDYYWPVLAAAFASLWIAFVSFYPHNKEKISDAYKIRQLWQLRRKNQNK